MAPLDGLEKEPPVARARFFPTFRRLIMRAGKENDWQKRAIAGVVKCPIKWGYWTSPENSSHYRPLIPNGI